MSWQKDKIQEAKQQVLSVVVSEEQNAIFQKNCKKAPGNVGKNFMFKNVCMQSFRKFSLPDRVDLA